MIFISMNAILLALTFTAVVVLDYLWDSLTQKLGDEKRAFRLKRTIGILLLIVGWAQVVVQVRKEADSDKNIAFLKGQLGMANISLTNAMEAVKGMSDGGTTWAVPSMGISEADSNVVNFSLWPKGDYPMRSVSVKITDETKRIEYEIAHPNDTNIPPSEPIKEKFIGDIPRGSWSIGPDICSIKLNPAITNHIRFDIQAMNGFSWEIHDIWKVKNGWQVNLHYRYRRLSGQLGTTEPEKFKGAIMAY